MLGTTPVKGVGIVKGVGMHIINMAASTNPMCREGGVILRGKWPCSR